MFNHLAGIVIVPTLKALLDRKVFDLFGTSPDPVELDQIVNRTHGNRGYLRMAFRLLVSCGWVEERFGENGANVCYSLTETGRIATVILPVHCGEVVSFLPKAIFLEDFLFGRSDEAILPSLKSLVQRAKGHCGLTPDGDSLEAQVRRQVALYLDGILAGAAMVSLARGGILDRLAQGPIESSKLPGYRASLGLVFDLLTARG